MLYREIMALCSEIHTKHINTLCGQNVELLNVKLVVRKVTTKVSLFDDIYRTIPGNIMLVHGSRKYCYVGDNHKILKFCLRSPSYFSAA